MSPPGPRPGEVSVGRLLVIIAASSRLVLMVTGTVASGSRASRRREAGPAAHCKGVFHLTQVCPTCGCRADI